jgi:hypothetical protein
VLTNNTSGAGNFAFGVSALSGGAGSNNSAFGENALSTNSSGNNNSAFGYFSLSSNTSGGANVGVGNQALQFNQTGGSNTAVGVTAGLGVASNSFSNDSLFGRNSGFSLTTGSNNVFLGYNSASTTATGGNNLLLGYNIDLPIANGSNQLDVGNLIFGTGINGQYANVSTGNIGIGTTTPYSRLTVWGLDAASSTLAFSVVNSASTTVFAVFDGGNAQLSGTLTQSSDARLKTNIQSLDASTSLAAINSLTPVAYDWIDPNKGGVRQYGFIAQQVQRVFPNLVSTTSATALTPDGTLGLNYVGLIAPLVEAVQTLAANLSSLATRVSSLEAAVAGFADKFTTKQLCVKKSDGTPVCLTGDQLASILSGTPSVQISAPTPPMISGTTTPPLINIQGNNPATINVGDTYTDLGAIAHDNQGRDLSYRTFINGVLSGNILIDTSQVATDTIDYVATDTWGNTATSTRTVIIGAATSSVQ